MAAASGDALSSGQADASSGDGSGGGDGGGARRRRGGGLGDGAGAGAGGLAKSRCDGAPPDHSVSGAASHNSRVRRHAAELVVDEAFEFVAELLRVLSTSARLSRWRRVAPDAIDAMVPRAPSMR